MIRRGGLEKRLRAVRAGKITFDEFARETSNRWTQIAEKLHGRWDVPTWYSVDDIKQDLLLAAWRYSWRFRPKWSNRKSVEHFSVWNGLHAAQKEATAARLGKRPHRDEGSIPSRYEIPVTALARDGEDDRDIAEMSYAPATQEDHVVRCQFFEHMAEHCHGEERLVLMALARHGSVEAAVGAIWDSRPARVLLKICNEDEVAMLVKAAIEKTAERVNTPVVQHRRRPRVKAA